MIDLTIFILKYAFLAFIYLFLFWLLRLIAKDLRLKSAGQTGQHAKLTLEQSPGLTRPRQFPIKDQITIGRNSRNTVVLDDEAVSAFHARIYLENGRFVLEDLGSTNGTFVANQIVVGPTALRSGATIKIGRSRLVFTGT